MSECLGAGSGCGWCIPFLKRIWDKDVTMSRTEGQNKKYAKPSKDELKRTLTPMQFDGVITIGPNAFSPRV